jgi:hypothetical protein
MLGGSDGASRSHDQTLAMKNPRKLRFQSRVHRAGHRASAETNGKFLTDNKKYQFNLAV